MIAALPHVLREYALIADGERGAVVGPRGEFAWMCTPAWDSDAVFSSLLGGPGGYTVSPRDPSFVWGGHYEDGCLIWRSRWVGTMGEIECREALALPADPHRAVVLRRVEAVYGPARVRVALEARAGFGAYGMTTVCGQEGTWTARSGHLRLRWTGVPHARVCGDALVAELDVVAGGAHELVLEVSDVALPDRPVVPRVAWAETERMWRHAVPEMDGSLAPRDARHGYAVMRGLTSDRGGTVAAATTSLPERAEAHRDYDYRYVWLRDQCYVGLAVASDGPHPLLDAALGFVSERVLADGPGLRPAYTTRGTPIPDETALGLPGYPGGRPCVGNRAARQFQLDVFGEALLLFAAGARWDRLDSRHRKAVEVAVEAVAGSHGRPGAGIWELDDRRWAHSRLVCVAGLNAVAQHVPRARAGEWRGLAEQILRETTAECLHPSGRWQRSPVDDRVDASLLMPPVRGALPAEDPRTRVTLAAIREDLASDRYLYRFRHRPGPLHEAEGAFLMCGFQMALALRQQGEHAKALRWFERNRAACGPPALFTEEYDVVQRQLRGNLPQAFVHALLLESARRLAEQEDDSNG